MNLIKIQCFDRIFHFDPHTDSPAWYNLDHAESENEGAKLTLDADREVYAVYESPEGEKRYGTIGDAENETLADNYPCDFSETYLFYENPDTKEYYV